MVPAGQGAVASRPVLKVSLWRWGVALQLGLRGRLELQVKLSLSRPRRWRLQFVVLGLRLGVDRHAHKACKGRVAWHIHLGGWSLVFCPRPRLYREKRR